MKQHDSGNADGMPPPATLAIHLDLVGGLAGDMFIAALVDAFPVLEQLVLKELAAVHPGDDSIPVFSVGTSGGLRVCRFGLPDHIEQDHDHHRDHSHADDEHDDYDGHDPHHNHMHTHHHHDHAASVPTHIGSGYEQIRRWINDAPLSPETKKHAVALLEHLGHAEADVHGVALKDVHFHELADWDSLMDLVAAGAIAGVLSEARWSASSLPLGNGFVMTAHGRIPVPAPATARLLTGYPWHDDGVAGERITPTGAALLRHLIPIDACGKNRPSGHLHAVGCGAGTRTLPNMPNMVRALVFGVSSSDTSTRDTISVIEFDVDDMSGEELATAADRLRIEEGVIDVSTSTRTGKKARPLTAFRVLVQPDAVLSVSDACFLETSTLGVRIHDEKRIVLNRHMVSVPTEKGALAVKIAERPEGNKTAKGEHDAVIDMRGLAARRRLRAETEAAALQRGKP